MYSQNDNLQHRDEDQGFEISNQFLPMDRTRMESGSSDPYVRASSDMAPGEAPPSNSPSPAASQDRYDSAGSTDAWLLQRAQEIYSTSTDYLDANITNIWERNLAHFNNQHSRSSKFGTKGYKRSNVFRPKTRSMVKGSEAAVAAAMFATQTAALITAENPRNEAQVVSAQINQSILDYRLKKKVRWMQTTVGQWQATKVYGLCISHQYWRYQVDTDIKPAFGDNGELIIDETTGAPMGREERTVRHDDLCIDPVEPENFRFSPMSDWRDPANTSPYLIYMMPIFAGDAMERMESISPKTGNPMWRPYNLAQILATRNQNYDRTRQAREGRSRIDPADREKGNSFTTVWAHMNIIKMNGTDMVFWTMGTDLVLTDPVPLTQLYPHLEPGERPFVVGFSTIEAFRSYPAGDVEQSSGMQEELNIIVNQRIDNVKLVLNKRYYVKRGAQVDLEALMRNVAGGGVMMNDPEKDVKTVDTNDVTSSSYQEQDRLSNEMDDLTGSFSPASVQSNRELNETVGGMNQLASTANAVQDYSISIFVETWAEPVLRQAMKLIQMYETDEVILTHAADQAQIWQKYGIDKITDKLLRQDLTLDIDVGMGNTDPMRRVEKLAFAVKAAMEIPGQADRVKGSAITDEIFSTLGYRGSGRYFLNDTEYEELKAQEPEQENPEIALKKQELELRAQDNQMRDAREREKMELDIQVRMADIAARERMTMEQLYTSLELEDTRQRTARDVSASQQNAKLYELKMKERTGSGI